VIAISGIENRREFRRLAGIGQHHKGIVVAGDHAEIAVAGFARMNEQRRRSGRGERRRHLAADVARLTHAADDDAAAHRVEEIDGGDESLAEIRCQYRQRFGRPCQHGARGFEVVALAGPD
jgi:hypothetical protein